MIVINKITIIGKAEAGYWSVVFVELTQSFLVLSVPNVYQTWKNDGQKWYFVTKIVLTYCENNLLRIFKIKRWLTVGPSGSKCIVFFVKWDRVNWENVFHIPIFISMTLECIFSFLNFWTGIQIFDGHTALDWTQNVAFLEKNRYIDQPWQSIWSTMKIILRL